MPKFIEVQNLEGDYYINVDHIARIDNQICGGQHTVGIVSSILDVGTICIYWNTEEEANACYAKIKALIKELKA